MTSLDRQVFDLVDTTLNLTALCQSLMFWVHSTVNCTKCTRDVRIMHFMYKINTNHYHNYYYYYYYVTIPKTSSSAYQIQTNTKFKVKSITRTTKEWETPLKLSTRATMVTWS